MGENELVVAEKSLVPMTITDVLERTALVRQVLEDVMIKDVHYGVIPGCGDKPTLLKPGAEKLCLTFRMAPEYVIEKIDLPKEHREYETTCNLYSIPGHAFIGSGVATCSTMETKYRYRNKPAVCPKCKAEAIIKGKKEYGGGWICWAKREGCGAKFEDGDKSIENQDTGKVENDNLSDQYNTVKKISAKRALTAATIVATSASDVFAQDLEDLKSNNVAVEAEVEIKDAETTTKEDMGKDLDKALNKKKPAKKTQLAVYTSRPPSQSGMATCIARMSHRHLLVIYRRRTLRCPFLPPSRRLPGTTMLVLRPCRASRGSSSQRTCHRYRCPLCSYLAGFLTSRTHCGPCCRHSLNWCRRCKSPSYSFVLGFLPSKNFAGSTAAKWRKQRRRRSRCRHPPTG